MTTSSYSPAPTYTISGIGPYDVPHEYTSADELAVSVVIDDVAIALDGADYSVVPAGPTTSGTVFLTPTVAATHDGKALTITRVSDVLQGWVGLSSTATGLEEQLDQMTRAIQETQIATERSLRVLGGEVSPYQPQDGRVPYWDSGIGSFANGLNYSDLLAGIEAANVASDRADIALHAINGGKWRTDAAALFADVDLTYAPGLTNTVEEGTKIITQAEGFGYSVAASTATDHHVTTAGGVKLYALPGTTGTVNILALGATGVAGDNQDAAMVAAAGMDYPIVFPEGVYDFSSNLELSSNWTGVHYGAAAFAVAAGTELRFTGTGIAIRSNKAFQNFTIRSLGAGQSGLQIYGGTGGEIGPGRILDFDTVGLEIGETGVDAAYFLDLQSFEVNNQNVDGQIGVRITGGPLPASNANSIRAPFVKGRWARFVDILGNNNLILGGDVEPAQSAVVGGMTEAIRISGVGNTWEQPYIEPAVSDLPDVMIRFTSTASGNAIRRIYSPSWGGATFASIVDEGAGNEVDIRSGSPSIGLPRSSVNILPNAGLASIDPDDNMPIGWNKVPTGTSSVARDDTHLRGGAHSIKLTANGDGYAYAESWVATHNPTARKPVTLFPAAKLRGKTVTFGAWCWSATPGFGAVAVFIGTSAVPSARHSGGGGWEFLTVRARIADTANEISVQLRSDLFNLSSTGECWFTEPVLVFGNDVPQVPEYRPLTDVEAVMAGRFVQNKAITFANGDTTPDISEGNVFVSTQSAPVAITAFDGRPFGDAAQEITIIPTNGNTYIANTGTVRPAGGVGRTLAAYEVVKFIYVGPLAKWIEV